MTKAQRISLMAELWPNACRTQGWHAEDRELRLVVCSIAVSWAIEDMEDWLAAFHSTEPPSRMLKSTNDLDDHEDFTRVKRVLRLLSDHVEKDTELLRRMRFVIGEQTKCLAVYLKKLARNDTVRFEGYGAFEEAISNAVAYVAAVTEDRFGTRDISDLSIQQLRQLMMTLQSRLHNKRTGLRVKAGDSIHDMCLKARIKCHCKECERQVAAGKVEEPF